MQKLCLPAVQKTFLALFKPCSQKCKNVYIQKHMLTNLFGADKFETHLTKQDNEEWAGGWARNEISSHNKTTIKQDSFGKQRLTCDFSTGKKIWRDEKTKVRLQSKHNICRGVLFHTWDVGQLHESERLRLLSKTSEQLDAKCDKLVRWWQITRPERPRKSPASNMNGMVFVLGVMRRD